MKPKLLYFRASPTNKISVGASKAIYGLISLQENYKIDNEIDKIRHIMQKINWLKTKISIDLSFQIKINSWGKSQMKITRKTIKLFPKNIDSSKTKGIILDFHCQKKHHKTQKFIRKTLFLPASVPK